MTDELETVRAVTDKLSPPSKIQLALRMVHAAVPEVTMVRFDDGGAWCYRGVDGYEPSFEEFAFDLDVLDAASDEAEWPSEHHLS